MKRLVRKASYEVLYDDVCRWDGTKTQLEEIRQATIKHMENTGREYYADMIPYIENARALIVEDNKMIAWFDPAKNHRDVFCNYQEFISLYINVPSSVVDVEGTNETVAVSVPGYNAVGVMSKALVEAQSLLPEWSVK
ncbi:hypothetical protein D3C71_1589240 [compost metagenome]